MMMLPYPWFPFSFSTFEYCLILKEKTERMLRARWHVIWDEAIVAIFDLFNSPAALTYFQHNGFQIIPASK